MIPKYFIVGNYYRDDCLDELMRWYYTPKYYETPFIEWHKWLRFDISNFFIYQSRSYPKVEFN